MDLKKFGSQLRDLRTRAGCTQEQFIDRLQEIAADGPEDEYRAINASLVSRWESAREHRGRLWKPTRQYVVYLVRLFANQLDPETAIQWADDAGYSLHPADLEKIFPDRPLNLILQDEEQRAREERQYLPPNLPAETDLFGIEEILQTVLKQLTATAPPWLVSIEGLGGIGKTSLAGAVVRNTELINHFQVVAWVSAKQHPFFPGLNLSENTFPALTVEALIDTLLEQFDQTPPAESPQEKRNILTHFLNQAPYMIVIDNLETVVDYQTLVPLLLEITNPSKVLLTSRHSLQAYPDIFCLNLPALSQIDTFALIRHQVGVRGLSMPAEVPDAQLQRIYDVVGGNPLALKLVVGQAAFLPLSQVLENLKAARGNNITDLYTYIYWQAWHMLDAAGQHTLLVMPLAQEGTLQQLLALSQLEPAELHQALQQLITLSLVQVDGGLEQRRYSIHRLTETFLLNEAITWQSSA